MADKDEPIGPNATLLIKIVACGVILASLVSVGGSRDATAGHIDQEWPLSQPPARLWQHFFDDYPLPNKVGYQNCLYISTFGLTFNTWAATYDWETTHGYGIDYAEQGDCDAYPTLTFKVMTDENECGIPPPGHVILACWDPQAYTYVGGLAAATRSIVRLNAPYMVAYDWSEAEQTWLIAHELGHAMALNHHDPCETVMATGAPYWDPCSNQVEITDVYVPRCLYGYTC